MGKISGYFVMPHPPIAIPGIGRGEDKKISATQEACSKIAEEINDKKPDTIIIITPHGPVFRDAIAISDVETISGNLGKFGASEIKFNIEINVGLTDKIIKYADEHGISIAPITSGSMKDYNVKCELDHGCMVPLYFINEKYRNYKLVHITYGILSEIELYEFGMLIQSAVETTNDCNAVVIASGDLSHRLSNDGPYEYDPDGVKYDSQIVNLLKEGDISGIFNMDKDMIEAAGECGMRSIYVLSGIMEGSDIKGEVLSYEGPFGVGYGVIRFDVSKGKNGFSFDQLLEQRNKRNMEDRKNESVYVRLARESLEYYLTNRKYIQIPDYATEEMINERRGAFVSLKKSGELRGCIGTILPTTKNVAQEIIRNAVEAGEHDPRFYPVDLKELRDISISVDVLTTPVPAKREELDPKRYGVIVRKGGRSGLLLPDLEGVNTVEEQLGIALRKGGISENENYEIEKFEVIRYR